MLDFLDMAAIPDFVSGAMENWGLVTYREARLLYDNEANSTLKAYDIVTVISHEFAHMWFGNLGMYNYDKLPYLFFKLKIFIYFPFRCFSSYYILVERLMAERRIRFFHGI